MSGRHLHGSARRPACVKRTAQALCPALRCISMKAGMHPDKRRIGACGDENGGWKPAYELIGTDQSLKGSENHRSGEW